MLSKFFILFGQLGSLPPKLYKTMRSVQKYKLKTPQYQFKQYDNQVIAKNAFQIYKVERLHFKINKNKNEILDQKIITLKSQKQQQSNSKHQKSLNSQNQEKKEQKNEQNIVRIKTLQQLQKEKQSLYKLTPTFQKLMYYYTPKQALEQIQPELIYKGFFDGCSKRNPGKSSAGYFISKQQNIILSGSCLLGTKTNNQAQFLSLLYLLVDAYLNGVRRFRIFGDSRLIVSIATGKMTASHFNIVDYAENVKKMLSLFQYKKIEHIDRKYNSFADRLANQAFKKKASIELNMNVY